MGSLLIRRNPHSVRKQYRRAQSRDSRYGVSYLHWHALWRFSFRYHAGQRKYQTAIRLLSRPETLNQVDPSPYYESPWGNRYEKEWEEE